MSQNSWHGGGEVDVTLHKNEKDVEYLEFCERLTKTRKAGCAGRYFNSKIFATGNEKCPIVFYKKYAAKHLSKMLSLEAPFHLIPPEISPMFLIMCIWGRMGENTEQKVVIEIARECGFSGKYINHSLHKTICQKLLSADVPPTVICQLTGHKSVKSLNDYTVAKQ